MAVQSMQAGSRNGTVVERSVNAVARIAKTDRSLWSRLGVNILSSAAYHWAIQPIKIIDWIFTPITDKLFV